MSNDPNPANPTWINGRPVTTMPVPQDEIDRRYQAVKDADAAIRATIKR